MTIKDGTWALPWTNSKVDELKVILNTDYNTLNDLIHDVYDVVGDDTLFDWLSYAENNEGELNNQRAKNYIKRRVYQFAKQYEEDPKYFREAPEEGVISELKKIAIGDKNIISKEVEEMYLKPFRGKMKDTFGVDFYVEGNFLEGQTETGFETFEEAEEFAQDKIAIISQNGMEKEIPLDDISYNIYNEEDEEIDLSTLEDEEPKKDSIGLAFGIYMQKASEAIANGKSSDDFVEECLAENERLNPDFLKEIYKSVDDTMEKEAEIESTDIEDEKVDLNKEDYQEEDFADITEEELNQLDKEDEFAKYFYNGEMINLMPKELFFEFCKKNTKDGQKLKFKYKKYNIEIEMPYSIGDGWTIYINNKSFINLTLNDVYEKIEKGIKVYEEMLSEEERIENNVKVCEEDLQNLVKIVNSEPTLENIGRLESQLEFYSDIYKDAYGIRPRNKISEIRKSLNHKAKELDQSFFDLDYSEQLKLMGY